MGMVVKVNLFKAIFEHSSYGLVILNDRTKIIYRNPGFTKLVDSPASGKQHSYLIDFLPLKERKTILNSFEKVRSGKQNHFKLEIPYYSQGGKLGWWLLRLTRIADEKSNRAFVYALIEDLTTTRTEEKRLREAKESAEKASSVKSEFLANMSHEIRTPIQTIIGMNELLMETELDAEQLEYASQVKFSADVLLSLINDILDFSKIEAGKLQLENIEIDLVKVLDESIDLVALETHRKGLELGLDIQSDVPRFVLGDPVRLRQILVNLINNAVRFTNQGQIVVCVERVATDHLKFSVEDSGIGISLDKKKRLFYSFSQGDSSTTRRFGGTGLGLSISKDLVEMMGGEIGVESTEGVGSCFWFRVPVNLKADRMRVKQPVLNFYQAVKVLVVDDNDVIRRVLKKYLDDFGCLVKGLAQGPAALKELKREAAAGEPYQICVIDQLMPGMDGWRLASEINADKSINSTKLVLLSPVGESGTEAKMRLLGWFDAYQTKPVKKELLGKAVFGLIHKNMDLESVDSKEEQEKPEKRSLEAASILVAEDHLVNQKLFRLLLSQMGHTVLVANNGKEVVDKALEVRPDLIFMDLQMPLLNGFDATRQIRRAGIRCPIIAITASVIADEKKSCLAAGMDDFLAKPFKKRDLLPVLERWLKGEERKERKERKERILHQEEPAVFDWKDAVDTFLNDEALVKEVLFQVLEKMEQQLDSLREASAKGDRETIRSVAHSVAGSALNLSIRKLGNLARDLELELYEKNMTKDEIESIISRIEVSFQELKEYVKRMEFPVGKRKSDERK